MREARRRVRCGCLITWVLCPDQGLCVVLGMAFFKKAVILHFQAPKSLMLMRGQIGFSEVETRNPCFQLRKVISMGWMSLSLLN